MSEFKSALKPYDLEAVLAADRGDDCLILDVGRNESGQAVASLKHVVDTVERYIAQVDDPIFSATKLYIVGDWKRSPTQSRKDMDSDNLEPKVSNQIVTPA